MNLLAENGIYLIQDLSNPTESIIRDDPKWNTELFATYAGVVDALAGYTNTLGFFAGNEVSNDLTNTDASAFVKAAVRDMKAYIKTRGYRTIGVGYATNDDAAIRDDLAAYFNCGDASDAIDFWGYNIYSWCGDSSFTESGFDKRTKEFEKYSVPAFFAEYGCNVVQPRKFTEVEALYGPNMTNVWSGGIMYMYFQEANDYGKSQINHQTSIHFNANHRCRLPNRHNRLQTPRLHSTCFSAQGRKALQHRRSKLRRLQHRCLGMPSNWNRLGRLQESPSSRQR
jgi:1,3-beta-glucanosyltransferase GAS1